MSDNIPFEIQMGIIKKVSDVKSLIQFRSVSKHWKSFIDSSEFIKGYGARHTQPRSFILRYKFDLYSEETYICLVDDDKNETFKVQQQEELAPFVMSPLLQQCHASHVVGACHGLICLFVFFKKLLFVIWNPSIGKSFGIVHPSFLSVTRDYNRNQLVFGFGVCPVTRDPTIVKILCKDYMPWDVEVFTLSSGVWNVIPCGNLPRQSIKLNPTHVVIGRFIYWGAREATFTDDGELTAKHMVVSFDLITKEFKVLDLPDSLTNELNGSHVFVSKLRESLVVYNRARCCGVWVMEPDSSFRKLFSIGVPVDKILGFKRNGEPIFEIGSADEEFITLNVYDPCSQHIKNLGISGAKDSFFMGSYKESLLLLDHSDLHIYPDNS